MEGECIMNSTTYTAADEAAVRTFVGAITGATADDAIMAGWNLTAGIIAEHGKGARVVVESIAPMPGKSKGSQNNAWTAVQWGSKVLTLVDDTDSPEGATAVMTEFNYRAATGDLPGIATTVRALLKAGNRFSTVAALAAALKAERLAVAKGDEEGDDQTPPAEKSEAQRLALLIAAVGKHAERYGLDPVDVAAAIFDHYDNPQAAADEAADEAELAS
jgi:hypothetical protein